jgi:outer membrane protein assembly factor BamA
LSPRPRSFGICATGISLPLSIAGHLVLLLALPMPSHAAPTGTAPLHADSATVRCPSASETDGALGLWIDRPLAEVSIAGLIHTRERVVQRELSARVGEPLDWNRLERDRLRLLDLGLFSRVDLISRRDHARDRPILEVRLRERPAVLALPVLMWEPGKGFTYGGSVSALNLGGMARQGAVSAGAGARRFLQIGYANRWSFGRRLGLNVHGGLLHTRNISQGTIEDHRGLSTGIAPARGPSVSFPAEVGWEEVRAKPDPHPAPAFSGTPRSSYDDHRWAGVGGRIDTRAYRARPRRGEVLYVGAAEHGGLLGGSVAMERYALDAMLVRPLGATVFTVASRSAISRGSVPSFLRLELGGPANLRGHPPAAYEGDNSWSGWVEERVPLIRGIEFTLPRPYPAAVDLTIDGAVFVDVGAIWNRGDWPAGRVRGRWGAGAGLRLAVPIFGLLSLDVATGGDSIRAQVLAGPRF